MKQTTNVNSFTSSGLFFALRGYTYKKQELLLIVDFRRKGRRLLLKAKGNF